MLEAGTCLIEVFLDRVCAGQVQIEHLREELYARLLRPFKVSGFEIMSVRSYPNRYYTTRMTIGCPVESVGGVFASLKNAAELETCLDKYGDEPLIERVGDMLDGIFPEKLLSGWTFFSLGKGQLYTTIVTEWPVLLGEDGVYVIDPEEPPPGLLVNPRGIRRSK